MTVAARESKTPWKADNIGRRREKKRMEKGFMFIIYIYPLDIIRSNRRTVPRRPPCKQAVGCSQPSKAADITKGITNIKSESELESESRERMVERKEAEDVASYARRVRMEKNNANRAPGQ